MVYSAGLVAFQSKKESRRLRRIMIDQRILLDDSLERRAEMCHRFRHTFQPLRFTWSRRIHSEMPSWFIPILVSASSSIAIRTSWMTPISFNGDHDHWCHCMRVDASKHASKGSLAAALHAPGMRNSLRIHKCSSVPISLCYILNTEDNSLSIDIK